MQPDDYGWRYHGCCRQPIEGGDGEVARGVDGIVFADPDQLGAELRERGLPG